jgi:hypothetical protein
MDGSRVAKWLGLIVVAIVALKVGLPYLQKQADRIRPTPTAVDNPCIAAAQHASDRWGSGIGRFTNPPYDFDAWTSFTSSVYANIATAESGCSCPAESCSKVRDAVRDLRILVGDLDAAIRSGSAPPGDIVQRQSAIDSQLDAARDLAHSGK